MPFVWSDKCQLALDYLKEIFCNKPILQFLHPNKPYVLYTDASNNAYSVSFANQLTMTKILGQLHIFQAHSQHKTEVGVQLKKKLMLYLDYYLRGMKCTLQCDHKPLEPFLTRGMKIVKLDRWVMLLQEYDITFVHIRGKDNILVDAISRLCTINVYEEAIENHHLPITQTTTQLDKKVKQIQHINSSTSPQLLNMNSTTLCTLQNKISSVNIKYKNYMQV